MNRRDCFRALAAMAVGGAVCSEAGTVAAHDEPKRVTRDDLLPFEWIGSVEINWHRVTLSREDFDTISGHSAAGQRAVRITTNRRTVQGTDR